MKKFLSMLLVLALLLGVWWVYGKVSVTETRVTAMAGEYEESFNAKGVIIRDEYPITSELSGTLQSNVLSGTRVTRYTNVGYVYAGGADDAVIQELANVNERINEINNMQDSTVLTLTDVNEINSKISSYCEQLAKKGYGGNNSELRALQNEINMLISRKRYLDGESLGENNDITSLLNRKSELENRLSGKRVGLGAPVSGLYYDFVDGYEGVKISDVTNLDPDKIKKIQAGQSIGSETEKAVCKIVDNSGWIVSIVATKDNVQGLAENQKIQLRFNGSEAEPVDAVIDSFVYSGNKVIVNIEGTCYVDNIYSERTCTVDVIKNTYRGLKIPTDAIIKKGEAGDVVEIRTSGGTKEKTVQVLYTPPDGTAIVKAGTEQGELLLYDEVIVKKKRR